MASFGTVTAALALAFIGLCVLAAALWYTFSRISTFINRERK